MENPTGIKQATGIVQSIQRNNQTGLVSLIIKGKVKKENFERKVDLPIKVNTDFDLIPLEGALLNEKVSYSWAHRGGYFDHDPKFVGSYPEEEMCSLVILSGKLKNKSYDVSWIEEDYKHKDLPLQLNQ